MNTGTALAVLDRPTVEPGAAAIDGDGPDAAPTPKVAEERTRSASTVTGRTGRHIVWLVGPLVAAVAVASWYDPGSFVAAGDIGPFFREGLAADSGNSWGYALTGAGGPIAEAGRSFDVAVIRMVGALGGGPVVAQQVFFWFWLTLASVGMMAFAACFVRNRTALGLVGVLAVANPLMATNLPNPLVAGALGTLGLIGACLVRAGRGHGSVTLTVLATLPVAYLAINPPTLAVVAVASLALAAVATRVGQQGAAGRVVRHLVKAVPLALLVHLWWIVPTILLYVVAAPETAAVTDPEAWAWTQVNSTIPNVASLTAHWGWGLHEYLPFSEGLDRGPVALLRWGLPALAVLGAVLARDRRSRRVAIGALSVAVLAVLLGKGLHGPAGGINRFLYAEVPGMWLLREPMSKIGPLLLGSYLVAAAIAVDGALDRAGRTARPGNRPRARAMLGVVGVLTLAAVSFGLPVLTGGVAPTERTPLPSSRVTVPTDWTDAAAAVNADPTPGKALVLPALPFYQATTDWGFHGVASLPRDLLTRPVVSNLPGSYFTDDDQFIALARLVESGDPSVVGGALEAMGVSHVLVRTDLSDAQAAAPVADGDAIAADLEATGAFDDVRRFGSTVTVLRTAPAPDVRISTELARFEDSSGPGDAIVVASLPRRTATVGPTSTIPVNTATPGGDATDATSITATGTGPHVVSTTATGAFPVLVDVVPDAVRLRPALSTSIDGRPVPSAAAVDVPAGPGLPIALTVDDRTVALRGDDPIAVRSGDHVSVVSTRSGSLPITDWSRAQDCDLRSGEAATISGRSFGTSVVLEADRHAACMTAPLPEGRTLLSLTHRSTAGDHARICVTDETDRCVLDLRVPSSTTAAPFDTAVDLPAGGTVFLYAEADGGPSRVEYTDIEATPIITGGTVRIPTPTSEASIALSEGEHRVVVDRQATPLTLGTPDEVLDCNAAGKDAELSAEIRPDAAVRLEATGNTACVRLPVAGVLGRRLYDVSMEHRTESGRSARWCLWMEDLRRCANDAGPMDSADEWRRVDTSVTIPDDAGSVMLYLYADGQDDPTTVTEYRDIDIRASGSAITTVRPEHIERRSVDLEVLDSSAEAHRVDVVGDGEPFVLSLADASAAGWRLDGLPATADARAVVVDGFRQGWEIDGLDGPATLSMTYGPGRWTDWAERVSLLAGLALGAGAAIGLIGRRQKRRAPDRRW